ncbi:hypothetical protein YTPLAS18_16000 [Nitrospira sp.]|nr:hypothetical protein YTPLAS18_16000 [Nitrospira sp.]
MRPRLDKNVGLHDRVTNSSFRSGCRRRRIGAIADKRDVKASKVGSDDAPDDEQRHDPQGADERGYTEWHEGHPDRGTSSQ